jgi:hypothetical protein
LHLNSCLLHPSWFMRTNLFRRIGLYNEKYKVAQDYEFLLRASSKGARFANLSSYLLRYRISKNGVSVKRRRKQLFSRLRLQWSYFSFFEKNSWIGLIKTLVLFLIPLGGITFLKKKLGAYGSKEKAF